MKRRRFFFCAGIVALTTLGTALMADLLWRDGLTGIELAMLFLFPILFGHIAAGFCTAMAGLWVTARGGDSRRITASLAPGEEPRLASTAIVIPVFNEEARSVFERVRVLFRSLEEKGGLPSFDFFILSDSNQPDRWIEEEVAWAELGKEIGGFGHVFYRRRRQAINRKAGNVADFLRRWGKNYRYMVVLDADSVMTGDALVTLVTLMEKNPRAGIIQTAPRLVYGETLYARLQAFSNRLHSALFLAGANYWEQGEGNYWGHNAIIRVRPFMEHCALPPVPGSARSILSHDFVEAALIAKAGWEVWLAYDLEGSYEESPPTLIDSAKRDLRWCDGNLQHTWLLTARGFRDANRFHLLMGIMAYISSPLWLFFLILGMIDAFYKAALDGAGVLRVAGKLSVFGHPFSELALFVFTLLLLFLPKLIDTALALGRRGEAARYGGRGRLLASSLLEAAGSVLLAPVNMLFNTKFVLINAVGRRGSWTTQQRRAGGDGTDLRTAVAAHGVQTAIGLAWAAASFVLVPTYFWWLTPVLAGPVFSIPLSILLSKTSVGRGARERGIFLTPEEIRPPPELAELERDLAAVRNGPPAAATPPDHGFIQTLTDPYTNAIHVALLRRRHPAPAARAWLEGLERRLLQDGPGSLTPREKNALLLDPDSVLHLHRQLWRRPGGAVPLLP